MGGYLKYPVIIIAEEDPNQPECRNLLDQSVAFIRSLYVEEQAHCYKLDELINGRFFIVRRCAIAIGCGAYTWHGLQEVELKHIFLEAAARGLGGGRALLMHMESVAKLDGVSKIVLETSLKQPQAVGLYIALGYGHRTPYAPCHAESIFMEKVI